VSNSSFPDEMETLQPKKTKPISQAPASGSGQTGQLEGGDAQDKDALTVKFAIGKLNDYFQWFLMVLEAFLAIRFLFRIFGVDPNNLFARFIFAITDVLLVPFSDLIKPIVIAAPNRLVEISTLVAMLIYFLIFWALKRFVLILIK
jgi:hypothetical protein